MGVTKDGQVHLQRAELTSALTRSKGQGSVTAGKSPFQYAMRLCSCTHLIEQEEICSGKGQGQRTVKTYMLLLLCWVLSQNIYVVAAVLGCHKH